MPVYDNLRDGWVKEEISLAQFGGSQVKLRFELRTDTSIEKDGWYIDDIGIFVYSAVPVELVNFTTDVSDKRIQLNWETASEVNNKGFEIQRATDPVNWNTIGFVEGAGTSTEKINYTFADDKPVNGRTNYRLKQVDFDGTFRIYGPVEVDFSGVSTYSLEQNYPNPFNPTTVINFQLPVDGFVSLEVFDILGREVASLINNEWKETGVYRITFDASNLTSGMYVYKLISGSFTSTKKMMLLR